MADEKKEKAPKKEAKAEGKKKEAKAEAKAEAKPKKEAKKSAAPKAKKAAQAPKPRVCKISACKLEYRAKGYCRRHYKKWRKGEYGKVRYKPCGQNECFRPMAMNRHGLCEEHYVQKFVKKIAAPPTEEAAPAEATEAPAEAAS